MTAPNAAIRPDPDATIALLSKVLRGTPKLPDAACISDPELFTSPDPGHVDAAICICRECPELVACRRWADGCGGSQLTGVVGGVLRINVSVEPTGSRGRPREAVAG